MINNYFDVQCYKKIICFVLYEKETDFLQEIELDWWFRKLTFTICILQKMFAVIKYTGSR